ncbi:MAG: hypothetical protein PHV37_00035 [Candidatus Gastranaerophilales bacterium]|nr:hypothetical protein [Candidatus Gastranaerophilales bacterium]
MKITGISFCNSKIGFKSTLNSDTNQSVTSSHDIIKVHIATLTPEQCQAYLGIKKADCLQACEISPKEQNKELAVEAVKFVKDMKLRSSSWMELQNPMIKYAPTEEYQTAASDIAYMNAQRRKLPIDEYVKMTKERVPMLGAGNCSDQAILAANYLIEEKGAENVGLVACTMTGQDPFHPNNTDQHVFAVLGLDDNADLSNPETWGENAVMVDPWANNALPIVPDEKGTSGINKLYSTFRTGNMIFENYAKYIDNTNDKNSLYNWDNHISKINHPKKTLNF